MKEKKLKIVDLATYLEVSQQVVSSWKNRNVNPPLDYLSKICDFLDTDVYELLDIEPKKQNELVEIYGRLAPEDKAIVDIIFNKYRNTGKLSSSGEAM